MKRLLPALLLSLSAQTASALDIIPFGGSQEGGRLSQISSGNTLSLDASPVSGLIIGAPLDVRRNLELFYSRQQTSLEDNTGTTPLSELFDVDVDYLHLGGSVFSEEQYGWRGFVSGGLGLAHFSPSLDGADAETRLSASVGIGAQWMPTPVVGMRLEGRLYGTLFNRNTSIFCSGGCDISVNGDLLTQSVLFAGVVIRIE